MPNVDGITSTDTTAGGAPAAFVLPPPTAPNFCLDLVYEITRPDAASASHGWSGVPQLARPTLEGDGSNLALLAYLMQACSDQNIALEFANGVGRISKDLSLQFEKLHAALMAAATEKERQAAALSKVKSAGPLAKIMRIVVPIIAATVAVGVTVLTGGAAAPIAALLMAGVIFSLYNAIGRGVQEGGGADISLANGIARLCQACGLGSDKSRAVGTFGEAAVAMATLFSDPQSISAAVVLGTQMAGTSDESKLMIVGVVASVVAAVIQAVIAGRIMQAAAAVSKVSALKTGVRMGLSAVQGSAQVTKGVADIRLGLANKRLAEVDAAVGTANQLSGTRDQVVKLYSELLARAQQIYDQINELYVKTTQNMTVLITNHVNTQIEMGNFRLERV